MAVVRTVHGLVRGEERDGVQIFRGIPYGGSCSGKNRFLPAAPAENWNGVKECICNGPVAVQSGGCIVRSELFGSYFSGGHPERFGELQETMCEDCLVIDLVTPGTDRKKRPVVVYIHGGGFSGGSGDIVLGADQWVCEEDIVLVGVHHRLNLFGYLYLGAFDPEYEKSGMAGIEDLILALKWVQENILVFGGDPGNVTLMGESGGAMKINILTMMKRARPLFHKVIIESGPLFTNYQTKDEGAEATGHVLRYFGLEEKTWKELLTIPAESFVKAAEALGQGPLGFFPTEDGRDLSYNMCNYFDVADGMENIPMLVGASEEEMGVFLTREMIQIPVQQGKDIVSLLEKKLLDAKNELIATPHITVSNAKEIAKELIRQNDKGDSLEHLYVKAKSICGSFGLNAFCQAEGRVAKGSRCTYQYLSSSDIPNPGNSLMECAWHTAELPLQMRIVLHEEYDTLSCMYARTFAAFARTGNPSVEGMEWPAYTSEGKETMIFDKKCRVRRYPYETIMELLLKESMSPDILRWNR